MDLRTNLKGLQFRKKRPIFLGLLMKARWGKVSCTLGKAKARERGQLEKTLSKTNLGGVIPGHRKSLPFHKRKKTVPQTFPSALGGDVRNPKK